MPAHIFIRVGRYTDAIEHNHSATHADERYIHAESPRGIYPLAYYPHNYDFLAFAAAMAGHRTEALEAAQSLSDCCAIFPLQYATSRAVNSLHCARKSVVAPFLRS